VVAVVLSIGVVIFIIVVDYVIFP
jgi:NADPH:quinone reductase-like Zn-dependent oxidoreductase